jgi:hypothetical protein
MQWLLKNRIILTHLKGWEAALSFFCVSASQWCQPKQFDLAYLEEHQSRCFSEFQLQLTKLFVASFQTQLIALTQLPIRATHSMLGRFFWALVGQYGLHTSYSFCISICLINFAYNTNGSCTYSHNEWKYAHSIQQNGNGNTENIFQIKDRPSEQYPWPTSELEMMQPQQLALRVSQQAVSRHCAQHTH